MRTQYQGWGALLFVWTMMSGIFVFLSFSNLILGAVMGAFAGWLFSLTFLGRWIIQGLNIFRLGIHPGNLYQIGAAAGFFSGFSKFYVKSPEWKKGKRA